MSDSNMGRADQNVRIVGADLGGTHTRVVVADLYGRITGSGSTAAGNPAAGPRSAPAAFETALRQALSPEKRLHEIRAGVIGMAGNATLRAPEIRASFDAAWTRCGLRAPVRYVSDLEVAFASGSDSMNGCVLIAGTGVAAGLISAWNVIHRRGGYGPVLGDEGGGYWLGRGAVRCALDAMYSERQSRGRLVRDVLKQFELDPNGPAAQIGAELLRTVSANRGEGLAALAPLVTAAAREGDQEAKILVNQAADYLIDVLGDLPTKRGTEPIVLAGSVLGSTSAVGVEVRKRLEFRYGARLHFAESGIPGALKLAIHSLAES